MTKPGRSNMPARPMAPRPGEGIVVDVSVDQFIATDGSPVANLGINLASAQVPDRKYTADTCALKEKLGTVKILFGQERVDGKGWRSLLVVQMSKEGAGRFLATLNQIGATKIDEVAAAANITPEALATNVAEPEQAIALSANLVFTAMSGNEACLDFYQASPFAIGLVLNTKKLSMEPVVRVDLRTSLLLGLITGLGSLGIKQQEIKTRGDAS